MRKCFFFCFIILSTLTLPLTVMALRPIWHFRTVFPCCYVYKIFRMESEPAQSHRDYTFIYCISKLIHFSRSSKPSWGVTHSLSSVHVITRLRFFVPLFSHPLSDVPFFVWISSSFIRFPIGPAACRRRLKENDGVLYESICLERLKLKLFVLLLLLHCA